MHKRIFVSAGEPSGDLHGSNLVRTLRQHGWDCMGLGGPRMQQAGARLLQDMTQYSVMGFSRVAALLPDFVRLLRKADAALAAERPDAVVMIDFPGFHWWLAWRAKAHGIPVYYYGTPQLWAWAPWRVRKMRRLVDHALCKLPFEEPWFRARGVSAHFVGHPYFDELEQRSCDSDFVATLRRPATQPLVALLPGSRDQEVHQNLPVFLQAVRHIRQAIADCRFVIASYNERQRQMASEYCQRAGIDIPAVTDRTPEVIEACDCCLACSGSVSLELLYHEKPTVIHYRLGRVVYALQRLFRTSRYITLVNLLAAEDITWKWYEPSYDPDDLRTDQVPFPEYLTVDDRSEAMASHIVRWLSTPDAREAVVRRLQTLKHRFATPGASERAATYIMRTITGASPHSHWAAQKKRKASHVNR